MNQICSLHLQMNVRDEISHLGTFKRLVFIHVTIHNHNLEELSCVATITKCSCPTHQLFPLSFIYLFKAVDF